MTHPVAQVNGIIKGTFYGTVRCVVCRAIKSFAYPLPPLPCAFHLQISDKVVVTCRGGKPGKKLKTIIEYKDEVSPVTGPV